MPADKPQTPREILIKRSSYRRMPWKNGGGETFEIDRYPMGDGPYLWRLSQAIVQSDGPFSQFPGFDRLLTVWTGNGFELNGKIIKPLQPYFFSGDMKVECKLVQDQVSDVGLIFDRSRVSAKMQIVDVACGLTAEPSTSVLYLFDLATGDTTMIQQPTEINVSRCLAIFLSKTIAAAPTGI